MLAFVSEIERDLILERTRARGRVGDRTKKDTNLVAKAMKLYDEEQYTVREIEEMTGVSKATLYRSINREKEIDEVYHSQ